MRSALFLLTALAVPALASTGGWEEDEIKSRHWRSVSLQWAQDIHPAHPSFQYLEANVIPPTEEMWCHPESGVTDTDQDCAIFDQKLDTWLHDYLEIPYGEPLPQNLIPFPPECSSRCFPTT